MTVIREVVEAGLLVDPVAILLGVLLRDGVFNLELDDQPCHPKTAGRVQWSIDCHDDGTVHAYYRG
jgi:hypothetical protein